MKSLIENYTQLNNSFKKKLVFHVGMEAGFFSEYNNMILAVLYCLENNIKFVLYSKDANFGYETGWADYFLPFCEEDENSFHSKCNFREYRYNGKLTFHACLRYFYTFIFHLLHKDIFLTVDKFDSIRDRKLENKHFDIPELGINGSLQEACRTLSEMTWRYNAAMQHAINRLIASLKLPENYIGFHIRSGDKIQEAALLNVSQYLAKIPMDCQIKNAFVLTDNYLVIEELRNTLNDWNIYTLCGTEECGYFHKDFEQRDTEFIRLSHEKLFASVDILSKSNLFIGTFSSNPGMYLGMRMSKDKVISVDLEKWQIW